MLETAMVRVMSVTAEPQVPADWFETVTLMDVVTVRPAAYSWIKDCSW